MASSLYFFQGSKTLLALLLPIFAVFASGHGAFLVSITLILMSTIFLFTICKQNPTMIIREAQISKIDLSSQQKYQEHTDSSYDDDLVPGPTVEEAQTDMKREDGKDQHLIASQDLYSESESMDQFSTTSSEDHSSDMEWPYNMGQRLDCSDDSISDEESLIEIAIPTGQFVSAEKDFKCCKLSHQESIFQKDFWADMNEINEEDNLIEIDIYMGSIKCSSFDI